jgi:PqqD family protein of HPr-rel-A system
VFDPVSGETHFLNELPVLLLQQLGATPLTLAELASRLAYGKDLGADALAKISTCLAELERVGLVESVAASA